MNRIAIIGAGALGCQLVHHIRATPDISVAGFFDDYLAPGESVAGTKVIGCVEDILSAFSRGEFDSLLVGIGYKHMKFRQSIFDRFSTSVPFACLIHPNALVDPSCIIEPGVVIYPGCILDMNVVVRSNSLLNLGCIIAHDSEIGSGCFLSPGVRVAGFVRVSQSVQLGIGPIVIDNISISAGVKTGGGAVVINSLTQPGLYVGVPARHKKNTNSEG